MKKLSNLIQTLLFMAIVGLFMTVSVSAATTTILTTPEKVTGLRQTSASGSSMNIAWNPANGCTKGYYAVQTSTDGVNWSASADTSYRCEDYLSGYTNSTTLYVRVAAYAEYDSDKVMGAYSDPIQVTTQPAYPNNIVQTSATADSVTISWTASAGATSYNIYSSDSKTLVGTSTQPSFTAAGLAPGSEGRYYVTAVRTVPGFSAESNSSLSVSWKNAPAKMVTSAFGISAYYTSLKQISFASNRPSTADGTEIEVRKVKKNKKVWTNTNSSDFRYSKNTAYKYRARAYVTIGGQKIYGAWSSYRYFATQNGDGKRSSGKLTVHWSKVKNVCAYKVGISKQKDSGYISVKKLSAKKTSRTFTRFGKKKISRSQTYYVKVHPIIKDGKKKHLSDVYTYIRFY